VFDVRLGTSEVNRAYAQSDSLGGSTDSIRTGTKSVSHDCLVFARVYSVNDRKSIAECQSDSSWHDADKRDDVSRH